MHCVPGWKGQRGDEARLGRAFQQLRRQLHRGTETWHQSYRRRLQTVSLKRTEISQSSAGTSSIISFSSSDALSTDQLFTFSSTASANLGTGANWVVCNAARHRGRDADQPISPGLATSNPRTPAAARFLDHHLGRVGFHRIGDHARKASMKRRAAACNTQGRKRSPDFQAARCG